MTATEWGELSTDDGNPGGDLQVGDAASRRFVTLSGGGFPVVLTVYAYGAWIESEEDGRRDLQTCTVEETYLHGAELGVTDPFDSEYSYEWPIDYWPASTLGDDEQPTEDALTASALAYLRSLSTAWIESMPTPEGVTIPAA